MAAVSPEELVQRFSQLGFTVEKHDHAPVPTVEAMATELAGLGVQGILLKNLFLKDKKNRLYIVSAHEETKVDLKVLSARLGMGKGGLRLAPEELLDPVLKLQPGSVTPLAVVQPSAAAVVLLIDEKLQRQERLLVHPLTNACTLALPAQHLDALLTSVGRTANYVDLEADPKIDKDNPPDLAKYISDLAAVSAEELAASANVDTSVLAAAAPPAGARKAKKAAGGAAARQQGAAERAMDVHAMAAGLVEKISAAAGAAGACAASTEAMRRLHADVVMELNGLRNAAYAAGMKAAKGQIMAAIDGSYA